MKVHFNNAVMQTKDAVGMANSVGFDQTAPLIVGGGWGGQIFSFQPYCTQNGQNSIVFWLF